MKSPAIFMAITVFLSIGAFLAPGAPFIVDGGIYYDMARAMAEHGSFAIAGNGGVEGAPPLIKALTVDHYGLVYPQYPSGYALLAAPFYTVFGIQGLMLMNALAFALSIWLTYALARQLYDKRTAQWAAGIFAIASFAPTYALGIWPHMTALAAWLGAIYVAVIAAQAPSLRTRASTLMLAGLLIGAGINIRVDVFLAGLILFLWLRLFARPQDRLAPVFLVLGMAPGLLLAAWINFVKFGTFAPFSYGSSGGADTVGRYGLVAAAAGLMIVAAWAANVPTALSWAWAYKRRCFLAVITIGALAIAAIGPLRDLAWRVLTGLYVLVINLQAHDLYHQEGVEKNSYGQLLFWGYPKKALIQSIPWLPLALVPCIGLLRGLNARAVSLCLIAAAAPLGFYALNHWHGGGSYSMRYFLPAIPFLALLAASGLMEIFRNKKITRQMALYAVVAASVIYLGLQELGQRSQWWFAPAALYPQWFIAAALCAFIIWRVLVSHAERSKLGEALCLFALAYAAAINLYEELGHERTRAEQRARAIDISAPLTAGDLIISPMQLSLIPAERNGVLVMAVSEATAEQAAAAATAFARAGRCVYFHNSLAVKLTAPVLDLVIDPEPLWAPSERFNRDPRLAFFRLQSTSDRCNFNGRSGT